MRRLLLSLAALLATAPAAAASGPEPGSPAWVERDLQNVAAAYGRITAPDGQLRHPQYLRELMTAGLEMNLRQLTDLAATPHRLPLTAGEVFPGWNVGNPLRKGWAGRRGLQVPVAWTNRYGALIRGHVFAPLPGAKDPYTGEALRPPYPGAVITTGSIQGSEGMYLWLAQDLAERGYVVLTYDVQGQGHSETLPHQGPISALPFCNPLAPPQDEEQHGCPGVPFQQESNFTKGTEDATTFFLSTPDAPYRGPASDDVQVNAHNPLWELFDRRPDPRPWTPGRTTRLAIIGHSLGASAVSKVQGRDERVATAVALDGLRGSGVTPKVPALAIQSEMGFTVEPQLRRPNPRREMESGFDAWRKAGVDVMLIVPRASTHLEYTDIPLALPASRWGQALSSVYVQAWLDRYLKHRGDVRSRSRRARRRSLQPLLTDRFSYLEPQRVGSWRPVTLDRDRLLSFYFCSGWALAGAPAQGDVAGVGGC